MKGKIKYIIICIFLILINTFNMYAKTLTNIFDIPWGVSKAELKQILLEKEDSELIQEGDNFIIFYLKYEDEKPKIEFKFDNLTLYEATLHFPYDNRSVLNRYQKYQSLFISEYGLPDLSTEEYLYPFKSRIEYKEIQAKAGLAAIASLWKFDNKKEIFLGIDTESNVVLHYADINYKTISYKLPELLKFDPAESFNGVLGIEFGDTKEEVIAKLKAKKWKTKLKNDEFLGDYILCYGNTFVNRALDSLVNPFCFYFFENKVYMAKLSSPVSPLNPKMGVDWYKEIKEATIYKYNLKETKYEEREITQTQNTSISGLMFGQSTPVALYKHQTFESALKNQFVCETNDYTGIYTFIYIDKFNYLLKQYIDNIEAAKKLIATGDI